MIVRHVFGYHIGHGSMLQYCVSPPAAENSDSENLIPYGSIKPFKNCKFNYLTMNCQWQYNNKLVLIACENSSWDMKDNACFFIILPLQ